MPSYKSVNHRTIDICLQSPQICIIISFYLLYIKTTARFEPTVYILWEQESVWLPDTDAPGGKIPQKLLLWWPTLLGWLILWSTQSAICSSDAEHRHKNSRYRGEYFFFSSGERLRQSWGNPILGQPQSALWQTSISPNRMWTPLTGWLKGVWGKAIVCCETTRFFCSGVCVQTKAWLSSKQDLTEVKFRFTTVGGDCQRCRWLIGARGTHSYLNLLWWKYNQDSCIPGVAQYS